MVLLISEHRGSLGKPHFGAIAQEACVGTMHFLLHYILQVSGHLGHDPLHVFLVEGVLDGAVLFEN